MEALQVVVSVFNNFDFRVSVPPPPATVALSTDSCGEPREVVSSDCLFLGPFDFFSLTYVFLVNRN